MASTCTSPGCSGGSGSSRSSTARASGNQTAVPLEGAVEDNVIVEHREACLFEGQRVLQALHGQVADRLDASADDARGDAHHQSVDQVLPQRRGDYAAAALDEYRLHLQTLE